MKLTVLVPFKDAFKPGVYYVPGDIIDIDDPERTKDLLTRKPNPLVEMTEKGQVINAVNLDQSAAKIKLELVEIADVSILENALNEEQNSEKPRKGVIQAINDRIAEL